MLSNSKNNDGTSNLKQLKYRKLKRRPSKLLYYSSYASSLDKFHFNKKYLQYKNLQNNSNVNTLSSSIATNHQSSNLIKLKKIRLRQNNRLKNNIKKIDNDDNVPASYLRLSIRNDPKSIPNNSDFVVHTSNDDYETKKIPITSNCSDSSFIAVVDETMKKDRNQVSKN